MVQANECCLNGRQAWKSFCDNFEDSTYQERVAQETGSSLKHSLYSEPKRNYHSGKKLTHTKILKM